MNNLQDQGRSCYKRGDYNKAIELFDRAIGRSPSVQLLDNRAACYEKLEDYSTALRDAKQAIQLHREDAVGYLRAGRLLIKMGRQSVALEIYMHGMKSIKHVGQGFQQLRKVHKQLMDELCPPKSVDPLTVLPRELAETILEHLSFRQRINACLVSKPWAHFIRSTPNLWQHLDFSSARRKVKTAFVSRAINVGRAKLRCATLSNLYDFDKTLRALVKHCPIEELTLRDCGLQSQNLHDPLGAANSLRVLRLTQSSRVNAHELRPILSLLSDRLEILECTLFAVSSAPLSGYYHLRCPKLKELILKFDDSLDHSRVFTELGDHFPELQKLVVSQPHTHLGLSRLDLRSCKALQHLDFHLKMPGLLDFELPSGITTLDFSCHTITTIHSPLPDLKDLHIEGQILWPRVLQMLDNTLADHPDQLDKSQPSLLRSFSLRKAHYASDGNIEALLMHPRMKAIESLSLAGGSGIDDNTVAEIASCKPAKLRAIDLTGAGLTGIGVKHLVTAVASLESLILNDCHSISPDAVEWARSNGVMVRYRMSSNAASGGKKVRY